MHYVPLRVHTAFSLAEGAIHIKDLATACQDRKIPAVAITDSNNLFGTYQFSKAISSKGVQPIIGCELSFAKAYEDQNRSKLSASASSEFMSHKLVVLAKSEVGYKNLVKLSSQAFRNGYENNGVSELSYAFLSDHNADLICLSGGYDGAINKLIADNKRNDAEKLILQLKEIFQDRFYLEVSRLGVPEEARVEPILIELAYKHNVPLVATNTAYFLKPETHEAHEVLLCIASGSYVSQDERRKSNSNFYLKSNDEMQALFKDIPEALENTQLIAQRCAFMVEGHKPILPPFETPLGEKEELYKQAHEGLKLRLEGQVFEKNMSEGEKKGLIKKYTERLDYELGVINQMGFDGYFLIVADFIKWALDNKIPVGPGRGSGAGSVVAWCLLITGLDPLKYGLLFERFLNPERVSMPDFDIDFCQEKRDEVINYVAQKYGVDHVAQIITYGKLQARAVVRDVGRVLQMPYGQVDRLSKLIPNNPQAPMTLQEAIDSEPLLREERRREETVDRLFTIGLQLEGLFRHASTHAAGVVIAGKPLEEMVGVYYDPRSPMPVTQFNMKDVESVGLVKFDFLGLKTLSVLKKSVEFVGQKGIDIDLDTIPIDDKKTYELLCDMDTVGVFQLESSGMRDVVGKLKPDRIEEIIALVALYRPGPMDNIPKFIACKHGREAVEYPHNSLEETLRETYGIAVYQEQVMQIAQVFAGYTLGGADLLRRAMGKKIKAEMDSQRKIFVEGAAENDISEKDALSVFEQVEKFAGYGFNKSHAAAYALVSYQTAYLKANYPVEFMAASMTFDIQNVEKLTVFKQDCERKGLKILPPNINASYASFSVERVDSDTDELAVRYALGALKNVGEAAMEAVVAERTKSGLFEDIIDFVRRMDSRVINKRQLEHLIHSGAFDTLHTNRKQLSDNIEQILSHSGAAIAEKESKQTSLFGNSDSGPALPKIKLRDTGQWTKLEMLQYEFDAVGFYLTAHPIEGYAEVLAKTHKVKANTIETYLSRNNGEQINLAGIILSKQERTSKASGKKFAFVQLSDETGVFEIGVFSDTFIQYREKLIPGTAVSVSVSGKLEEGNARLILKGMELLDEYLSKKPSTVVMKIDKTLKVKDLSEFLSDMPTGKCTLEFNTRVIGKDITISLSKNFKLGEHEKSKLLAIKGIKLAS